MSQMSLRENENEVYVNFNDENDCEVAEQGHDISDTNDAFCSNNDDRDDDDEDSDLEETGDEDTGVGEKEDAFEYVLNEATDSQRGYPARPTRGKKPFEWYKPMSAKRADQLTITISDEPTLSQTLNASPEERDLWKGAIDDEMKSADANNTWAPDRSPESQPLPTHAILKIKRNADGNGERFKARVVAAGNHQVYCENYKETYAPVVSFTVVQLFLYLTLCLGICLGQVNVKTAFLKGELFENVWVMSSRGISEVGSTCYRLCKAMCGLKQAHLAWNKKLGGDHNGIGLIELASAACVFRESNGCI